MWVAFAFAFAKATRIFFSKNTRELYTVITRTRTNLALDISTYILVVLLSFVLELIVCIYI